MQKILSIMRDSLLFAYFPVTHFSQANLGLKDRKELWDIMEK